MTGRRSILRPLAEAGRAALATAVLLALAACAAGQPGPEEYARYEAALVSLGDLRTDTAPDDAPYDNADLVRNFGRIALRHEVDIEQAGDDGNSAPNPVQRWDGPIRWRVYGEGAEPGDHLETARLIGRLSELSGLPAREADDGVNMMILITVPEEREAVAQALARVNPSLGRAFDLWRRSADVVCTATNLVSEDDRHRIVFGMILIGSEVQGLLRRSCLHEELTQALGLGNDHPDVRPSIFNDDEEFALLTEHDEWLIRILYDGRLLPGMAEDEALAVAREVVRDLRPEGEP